MERITSVNGLDKLSKKVIETFDMDRYSLAEIAELNELSLDQVKRLKRYYNYGNWILKNIGPDYSKMFLALGLKGLKLSEILKKQDIHALTEILPVTSIETRQADFKELIQAYNTKQAIIEQLKIKYDTFLDVNCERITQLRVINEKNQLNNPTEQNELALLENQAHHLKNELFDAAEEDVRNYTEFHQKRVTMLPLNKNDITYHIKIQNLTLRWLLKNNYTAAPDVLLPNGVKGDVVGYNDSNEICIISIQTVLDEFNEDILRETFTPYCNNFYIFMPQTKELTELIAEMKSEVLVKYKYNIEVLSRTVYPHKQTVTAADKKLIKKAVLDALIKRVEQV